MSRNQENISQSEKICELLDFLYRYYNKLNIQIHIYFHYKLSPSSLSTLKTVVDACWHSEIKCDIEQKAYSEVNWNET